MNIIEINIVDDILKSRFALHEFGKPVQKLINEKIAEVNSSSLFVLNLKRANPMDYEFVIISFTEIINAYKNNSNVFIVFKVESGEFDELCTGLIDILNLQVTNGQDEANILRQNGFSMIYITENGETNYLSNLSEIQISVLTEIENNDDIDSDKIQTKFSLKAEEISGILDDLVEKKFVIRTEDYRYKSIKSFI